MASCRLLKETRVREKLVSYELKRYRKSKHIRISIYHDGRMLVTAPLYTKKEDIEDFIRTKNVWVQNSRRHTLPPVAYVPQDYFQKHKGSILQKIIKKVQQLNFFYQFSFTKIDVKDHMAQWGSCTQKGSLYFNYRVAFLRELLLDYIVVHELCHLKEFNHSPAFWQLVGESIPHYRAREHELRTIYFQTVDSPSLLGSQHIL